MSLFKTIVVPSIFYFLYVLMSQKQFPIPESPFSRLFIFPLVFLFIWKFKEHLDPTQLIGRGKKILVIIVVLLGFFRFGQWIYLLDLPDNRIEDIATAYENSINVLIDEAKNPYSSVVDRYPVGGSDYSGLKYFPLQLAYYAPFVRAFGLKGIRVANGIVYFLLVYLLFILLSRVSLLHALLGSLWYFATDYVFVFCINRGINDYLPVLLMFGSLTSLKKNGLKMSGFLLGMSIAAKQLPGGVVALILLAQKRIRVFLIACGFCFISIIPFLVWDFHGFYRNTFEFMLHRPARDSSLLYYLPEFLVRQMSWLNILSILVLSFLVHWKYGKSVKQYLMSIMFIFLLLFIVFGKMTPTNYFVWLSPFAIIFFLNAESISVQKNKY